MTRRFANIAAGAALLLAPALAHAQLYTLSKDQMVDLTKQWTGERFADGRPKVADSLMQRAHEMSAEEVWSGLNAAGGGGGGRGGGGAAGRKPCDRGGEGLPPEMAAGALRGAISSTTGGRSCIRRRGWSGGR